MIVMRGPLAVQGVMSASEAAPEIAQHALPELVDADEIASWLRTTRKAVYAMCGRAQLPAPVRIGRRLLWQRAELVYWFEERRAPSPQEKQR
jgi:predicted DNA-binding transcriptional regulator AlpA